MGRQWEPLYEEDEDRQGRTTEQLAVAVEHTLSSLSALVTRIHSLTSHRLPAAAASAD